MLKLTNHIVICTKQVLKNKLDENGIVVRNKAKLITKRYNQKEEIDFDETYTPIARLKAIKMLLAYAYYRGFKLH